MVSFFDRKAVRADADVSSAKHAEGVAVIDSFGEKLTKSATEALTNFSMLSERNRDPNMNGDPAKKEKMADIYQAKAETIKTSALPAIQAAIESVTVSDLTADSGSSKGM